MSIDFPSSDRRKMHVTRIFGTNADGDLLTNIWVDVLRVDELKLKTQDILHYKPLVAEIDPGPPLGNLYQEVTVRLKWDDDGEDRDISTRETEIIKVCGPNEDPNDPSEWVPIPVIKKLTLTSGNVGNTRRFLAASTSSVREVTNCRVVHYDTNIDDGASKSGQKTYVVDTDSYSWNDDSKDIGQYVEHEIATKIKGRSTHHWLQSNGDDLETFWTWKNDFLIDAFDEATLETTGPDGFNPPYRLDPYQNIINCQFSVYANRGVFGDACCFVGASRDGQHWVHLGSLSFGDVGSIESGEWLINQKLFVLRGAQVLDEESNEHTPLSMTSPEGFGWSANGDDHYGVGANAGVKPKPRLSRVVNGHIYRVNGDVQLDTENTPPSRTGLWIERSAQTGGDESTDDNKIWEVVATASQFGSDFKPRVGYLGVMKGDGPNDVPVIVAAVQDKIVTSTDGLSWHVVYTSEFVITAMAYAKIES